MMALDGSSMKTESGSQKLLQKHFWHMGGVADYLRGH
jgi:hypothetical protein